MSFTTVYQPDLALTGWAALQAGMGEGAIRDRAIAEDQRRFQVQQALQQQQLAAQQQQDQQRTQLQYAQLGQQATQFDRTQGDAELNANRNFGQQAYQFDQGAADRFDLQQQENRFRLLQQGIQGDQALQQIQARSDLDTRGQDQYALHSLDDQARLDQESMRQGGLGNRTQLRSETQLEAGRKTQAAKMLHDEWAAIVAHAPDMTPEQWASVVDQFKKKAEALGMEPPVDMPQPQRAGGYDPAAVLQELQQRHPDEIFHLDSKGNIVHVPRSATAQGIQSKQDHDAQLKDKEIQAKAEAEATKAHAAAEAARSKETAAEQQNASKEYFSTIEKARKFSMKKDENGNPYLDQDMFKNEIAYANQQFVRKHGYAPPVKPDQPSDSGSSQGSALPNALTPADVQKMYESGAIKVGDWFIGPDGQPHQRMK